MHQVSVFSFSFPDLIKCAIDTDGGCPVDVPSRQSACSFGVTRLNLKCVYMFISFFFIEPHCNGIETSYCHRTVNNNNNNNNYYYYYYYYCY